MDYCDNMWPKIIDRCDIFFVVITIGVFNCLLLASPTYWKIFQYKIAYKRIVKN